LTDKQTAGRAAGGSNVRWWQGGGPDGVGSAAGVSVARSLRRHVSTDDPYEDEDFELLDATEAMCDDADVWTSLFGRSAPRDRG